MFRVIPRRALIEPQASVTAVQVAAGGAAATLRIEGLLCSACAAHVRGRLKELGGVHSARVDLERGEARVIYDPTRATPQALIAAVEEAVMLRPVRRLLAALGRLLAREERYAS